jgi:lipopolysaccharide export system protein LptA
VTRRGWLLLVALLLSPWPGHLQAAEVQQTPITISSDSLQIDRKARLAVYKGNVVASDKGRGLTISAAQIEFFFDDKMEEVERAVATQNVRLSYGQRRGTADQAEYFPAETRAVLLGHPRVWQNNDVITGCRITLWLREDRSQVDGCEGERVNAVLYPKRGEGLAEPPRSTAPRK